MAHYRVRGGPAGTNEGARTVDAFDDPAFDEFFEGAHHRSATDAQCGGEGAFGREALTVGHGAGIDGSFDRRDDS